MTITDLGECIKPVTYMKTNAVDMMSFVNDRKEPMIITQDGESRAVLMDIESYEECIQYVENDTNIRQRRCRWSHKKR